MAGPRLGCAPALCAVLLGATMALLWYTTYHLARSDAAQPRALCLRR